MYEVELKVRADLDRVERRLEELDAADRGAKRQVDTYYDAPHRDFAETDEALRIRETTPLSGEGEEDDSDHDASTSLTYKGPLVEAASKTREEHETTVADPAEARAIFDGLGFEPAAEVRKERHFYELDGYTVTLDDVEGAGRFVEVEREADAESLEAVRRGAADVLERLGLDAADQIRTSYLGLILAEEAE
ncbi:class IV adenylate cyclase [Haloparvum sp. PAK95]|uniref:class IV adenylate cyclase n=1 Tax=Haloparvum sp. PAK95 TaxID=3418962 RepID=UPI003D2E9F67